MNRLVVGSNPTARATSILTAAIERRRLLIGAGSLWAGGRAARAASRAIRLAWPAGAVADIAVVAARQLGLFAQYGLDVQLVDTSLSGTELAGHLAAGAVDAAAGPVALLLDPLRNGLDAKLTTGISGGGMRLLAERRSGLRHIEDVKHKRIGVADLRGPSRLFFSIMMRRKGIDPFREVSWIQVDPFAQEDALRARRVDAVAASDPQAFFLLRALLAVEIASNISGSYRQRVANVLACGGALLRNRAPDAAQLTRAVRQASAWAASHVEQAAAMVADWAPRLDLDNRIAMLRSENIGERPVGGGLIDDVAEYADELRLLGTFPYELNADSFARSICVDVLRP